MLPGPTLIIACPACKAEHLLPTLASGNTLGARYWTDGYCEAPMLPEIPKGSRFAVYYQENLDLILESNAYTVLEAERRF